MEITPPIIQKYYINNSSVHIDVNEILKSFSELSNGQIGAFNITALQVAIAFTKTGITPLLHKLLKGNNNAVQEYINHGDQLGRTPLHYATMNGNFELVELLLNYGARTECKFLYRGAVENSKIDYIKWNKLYVMLPPPEGWGRTPLHIAVKDGKTNIVKLLIQHKANVNVEDEKGITPLLLAGGNKHKNAFEDIVEILVDAGANVHIKNNVTGTTALFHAVALKSVKATEVLLKAGAWLTEGPSEQTELHEVAANGILEMLEMFLEDGRITVADLNKPDDCGRTPLYRAANGGNRECLKALINRGGSLAHVSKTQETVMDVIFTRISRPAHFIRELLDERITANYYRPNDENYRIKLDYSILVPLGNNSLQMDVISNILVAVGEKEKVDILQHPLIESFLRLKWAKIRIFFFLLIISYSIFVLSLSIYVVLLIHNPGQHRILANITRYIVIVTGGGLSVHAIIQCSFVRRKFWKQFELWIYLSCTILSLIIAFSGVSDGNRTDSNVDPPNWILHAASVAVLLAWAELMLLIGRNPTYGYYALMFAAVLQNVIKVLLTFVCLVIGFALSFSIQFKNYEQFTNPWRAVVKTTVMMMGEFEYGDLFTNSEGAPERLQTTSRIIFLLFVILASIVLMNLMVGLAVSDIQGLQQESHALRLEKQAEFLRQLERVIAFKGIESRYFPSFIRNFLRRKRHVPIVLNIRPDLTGYITADSGKTKRLPCELIESIMTIANSHQREQESSLRNARLPEILQALKMVIAKYERRTSR